MSSDTTFLQLAVIIIWCGQPMNSSLRPWNILFDLVALIRRAVLSTSWEAENLRYSSPRVSFKCKQSFGAYSLTNGQGELCIPQNLQMNPRRRYIIITVFVLKNTPIENELVNKVRDATYKIRFLSPEGGRVLLLYKAPALVSSWAFGESSMAYIILT